MTTKLTLTIQDNVITSAKKYANKKGESLSRIVENYLKTVSSSQQINDDLSPKVKNLMGVIKLSKDFNYKDALKSKSANP